ncbi:MAG: helix-turn-helix domain-containing protein [Hyphomicrobiaceae bacterium]
MEAEDSLLSRNYSAVLYEELLLTTLLTGFPHSHSSRFEKSVFLGSSKTVKQAQDYFEQHADKPITVSDVAEAVGVSVRSLQRTFQKITGYSPMRYLYNLRLDRARKRIVNAGPEANITQIAIMSGFTHAGAFSINYKRRFGESPSQTARNYS